MDYLDKINYYEGVITEVHDGAISVDILGRLGNFKVPMRMVISDNKLEVGQKVAFKMSFIIQL